VKNLTRNVLLDGSMHVSAIRSAFEFYFCRISVSILAVSEPYICPMLATSAGERTVFVVEAVVGEVVVFKAVGR
jgi:hypothetical protein